MWFPLRALLHAVILGLNNLQLIVNFFQARNGLGHVFRELLHRSGINHAFESHIPIAYGHFDFARVDT
jgi:hypothetical protein